MINLIKNNTISGKIAKIVFEAMWNGEGNAKEIIKDKNLQQVTDSKEIEKFVDEAINENKTQVDQYKKSTDEKKQKLISFFVGQIMKKSKGKAAHEMNSVLKKNILVIYF